MLEFYPLVNYRPPIRQQAYAGTRPVSVTSKIKRFRLIGRWHIRIGQWRDDGVAAACSDGGPLVVGGRRQF